MTSNSYEKKKLTIEEVALGFITVANESMCRPIRAITQGKGLDTSGHVLACFGGAGETTVGLVQLSLIQLLWLSPHSKGGQHACAIARSLGISKVFVHKYAGNLSAYGMALADVVHEETLPCNFKYERSFFAQIDDRIKHLVSKCIDELRRQAFQEDDIKVEIYLNMKYEKTDFALMTRTDSLSKESTCFCTEDNFKNSFLKHYRQQFGFTIGDRNILVDDIRVRGVGSYKDLITQLDQTSSERCESPPEIEEMVDCYFEQGGYLSTPIYLMRRLRFGHQIRGPAIIIDDNFTVLVEPECRAELTSRSNILIEVSPSGHQGEGQNVSTSLDAIQLSIFSHRFMSIAEQMGRVLQRTSISTNIKERLDFSCALFGPEGGLVSNAPHIPVHLGSMGKAVEFQLQYHKDDLSAGDVLLTNHPAAGGQFQLVTVNFNFDWLDPIY